MKAMKAKYSSVFGSGSGKDVLANLLYNLNYFGIVDSEEGMIRHNIACEILELCKVLDKKDGVCVNSNEMIDSLMKGKK